MTLKAIPNEKELLLRVAGADEEAFAGLFYACHQSLGSFVHSLVDSRELTEDIVQEVFVKIWMERTKLPEIQDFSAYLFILTRNYTLNCLRKIVNDRRKQQEYADITRDQLTAETGAGEEGDYLTLLDRAVAQLPPQQKKVFELRKAGFKNGEIADLLGLSVESVKKYQHLALRSITEFIRMQAAVSAILALFNVLPGH